MKSRCPLNKKNNERKVELFENVLVEKEFWNFTKWSNSLQANYSRYTISWSSSVNSFTGGFQCCASEQVTVK